MKTAIIHYWFVTLRGGEKVIRELCKLFPDAVVFSHVSRPSVLSRLGIRAIRHSFISRIPGAVRNYQWLLPLMYPATRLLPLKSHDLIISSMSGPASWIKKSKKALHVCYCHSPPRYLWDMTADYMGSLNFFTRILFALQLPFLRWMDRRSVRSVDLFIANSNFIKDRIRRVYGADAVVVHPPVELDRFTMTAGKGDYFIYLGQLVPYKSPELVIEAFTQLQLPLMVVGEGPMEGPLRSQAAANIQFTGRVDDAVLVKLLAKARALVFAGIEDFGIVFVEALASGTPVIAYEEGGVKDIIQHGKTGVLFQERSSKGVVKAVESFISQEAGFSQSDLCAAAKKYGAKRFRDEIMAAISLSGIKNE